MILCGDRARRLGLVGLLLVLALWAAGLLFSPGLAQTRPADQEKQEPLDQGSRVLGERLGEPLTQARPKPQDPTEPAPREVYRGKLALTEQQDLKDEIELLTIQLEAKKAELQEVEALAAQAHRRATELVGTKASGAVSSREVDQAQTDERVQTARMRAKLAQVREVELRLTQANRRLGRARQPDRLDGVVVGNVPGPAAASTGDSRFDSLEKKLDALTREVAALRQELRLQRPRDSFPDKAPVYEKTAPPSKRPAPEKAPRYDDKALPPSDAPATDKPPLAK